MQPPDGLLELPVVGQSGQEFKEVTEAAVTKSLIYFEMNVLCTMFLIGRCTTESVCVVCVCVRGVCSSLPL